MTTAESNYDRLDATQPLILSDAPISANARPSLRERQESGLAALIGLARRMQPATGSGVADQGPRAHVTPQHQPRHSRERTRSSALSPALIIRRAIAFVVFAGLFGAVLMAAWNGFPPQMIMIFILAATAFNMTVGTMEAHWRLYAWRHPEAAREIAWPKPIPPERATNRFSLIVPALDEADVIGETLRGLARQSHPRCEIIVSLCASDRATVQAVRRLAEEHPDLITVLAEHYEHPSKAQQLNRALELCRGDVVGVIDAEDDVASDLLVHVEALFTASAADVVQGGVQLVNLGDSPRKWFQVHNVLEYFFWFTSRMAYQASVGFVPLGGNTVFIRRDLLRAAGGWPLSLTEDCALGVVLATRFNAKVVTAYSAELSTREEVPPTIFNKRKGSLFWQRDRWARGFLAELISGKWLQMPTLGQRFHAGYILATPFLQAISLFLAPLALLTAITVKTPVVFSMLTYLPFIPMTVICITQLLGLKEFSRSYGQTARVWHYISLSLLAPFYQTILMAAALTASYKYLMGDTKWYKTGRANEHRGRMAEPVLAEGAEL